MFGSVTNLDEDLELDTGFFPVTTSTQSEDNLNEKRKNELVLEENAKRFKNDMPQNVNNSQVKISSFEKYGKERSFSPGRVAKRMFPGPAGLLSDLDNNSELICHNTANDTEDFLFCSQQTVSTFMDKPWTMMKTDYYSIGTEQLYDKFTISWIKKKYCPKNQSFVCKVPFLAAVIQNLETVDAKIPSVHITLKDQTGVIDGTILYSFYKGIANHLTVGSVVILKQFGVLSNHYGHCLTITANNLLVIYHLKDMKSCDKNKNEHVEKMIFQQCRMDEILKGADDPNGYESKQSFFNKIDSPLNMPFTNNLLTSNKKDSSGCMNFMLPKSNTISPTNHSGAFNSSVLQNMDVSHNTSIGAAMKKFTFKKVDHSCDLQNTSNTESIVISSSQMSVEADKKDTEIWKNVLEDVDTDLLFGDF